MKIFLVVLFVIVQINSIVCPQPQRTFYMSYPTLSKRDMLSNLFQQLDKNMTVFATNYTDSGIQATFQITNLLPQTYYNDHHQIDKYIDKYRVNVSMGVLSVSSYFNFSVYYGDRNKSGNIRINGFFDPSYFTKNLTLTEGYLEWKPDIVPALSFSQQFHIQYNSTALTENQINIIQKMVNGLAGPVRIKLDIQNLVNARFVPLLTQHLNHEQLLSSNNITYQYRNITLNFMNYAQEFGLTNGVTKGLEAFLQFGLESNAQNCTQLPKEFDEDQYGGLQEVYTMGVVRSMIKQGIFKGLFDVTLNQSWQVPGFQFYMGDLGNFIPYANYAPSNQTFKTTCKYNLARSDKSLKIGMYAQHEIYISFPQTCIVNYNNADILSVDMDISFYVRLYGEEDSIKVVVTSAGVFGVTYKPIDSKYQLGSQYIAKYSISEVLNGLVGKSVFGSDFPIIKRRYPVIRVFDDSIIVFDPSEP